MYKGSCLCGGIRFQINGAIDDIIHCHCSLCRKGQGGAFASNGVVKLDDFTLLSGIKLLHGYQYTPEYTRYFCRNCGSPIYSVKKTLPGSLRIRLGVIESDIVERPCAHIFVASKANWDSSVCDDLPRFEAFPTTT